MGNIYIKKIAIAFASLYAVGLHPQVMFAKNDVLKYIENNTPLPYIAIKGDTLIGLSDRYLSGNKYWKVLKKINAIDDPYRIPIGTVIKMPPDLLRSVSISAMLAGAWGLVRWRRGSADWKVASVGDTLSQGDEIEVNAASSAVIEFPNGTRINLHAGTKLKFDALLQYPAGQMTDARLNLKHGHIEINDNPQQIEQQNLRVTTPGAQAIVRGTNFRVTVSGAETREETLQGLIELFADGKSILVPNSQGAVVTGNKLPDSIKELLEPPDLSDVKAEYQQSDLSIQIPDANRVQSYAGQISKDARFDAITAESNSNSAGVLKFVSITDGSYYLRVRALDEYSLQGKDAIRTFKVNSKPAKFTSWQPIYPANLQVVRDSRPKVEWSGPLVTECRIQMSKESEFERPQVERRVFESKIIMDVDLSLGSWYWRIICDPSADHAQIQSNVWSFAIRPTLDIGKLGMPELKFDSSHLYVELPKTPYGVHYRVGYIRKDSGESVAEFKSAAGGRVSWPRPPKGNYEVVSYLEDDETNEQGKWVSQEINIPANNASEFLYFLPLLLML